MNLKRCLYRVGLTILAISLLLGSPAASANVVLSDFRAEARPADTTIRVTWQTASELNTAGFRLYRAENTLPTTSEGWGNPINEQPAKGDSVTGADYEYIDTAVSVGARYYYQLREVTSSGGTNQFPPTAGVGIGVATDTPSPTPTITNTPTPSPTLGSVPTITRTPTATVFRPEPTATRRFTETPVVFQPSSTPTRPGGATVAPPRTPTRTPLPGASVATPTGGAPQVTLPAPTAPTATLVVAPLVTATRTPTNTATETPTEALETPTPKPTKEVTPIIFAAETTQSPATPEASVAGQGRSTSLALVIGGSAIGLAGVLGAALLFLRSRRP